MSTKSVKPTSNTCGINPMTGKCFPGAGDDCVKCPRNDNRCVDPLLTMDFAELNPQLFNYKTESDIHPTAIMDSGASIGEGTRIWHYSHISSDAVIGSNCIIGDYVFIGKGVKIGSGCKIQNNSFLPSGVELEEGVFIGPSVVFTNVINPRAFIERKSEFRHTLIEKGASIGANSTILCGVNIEKYAMIGAGSVVTKEVGAFRLAFGNPAEVVGAINEDGTEISYF
jgi:UDP-2-acetamido-3-amino-2,3-dideoxy-glucuronate N-acetyltransferase